MKQLVHVVGTPLLSPAFEPPGLPGRDGATLLNPDSGGELGDDCGRACIDACWPRCTAFGVELVRGIFCLLGSLLRLRISVTEAEEPCVRVKLPPLDQSCGEVTVSVPPIVTCFLGGPPGYLAAIVFICPPRLESQGRPLRASTDESSMPENSVCIIMLPSVKVPPSSSSLSESSPNVNMVSLRDMLSPCGGGFAYSGCI